MFSVKKVKIMKLRNLKLFRRKLTKILSDMRLMHESLEAHKNELDRQSLQLGLVVNDDLLKDVYTEIHALKESRKMLFWAFENLDTTIELNK